MGMKSYILVDGGGTEIVVIPSNFHSTDDGGIVFEVEPGVAILSKGPSQWRAIKPVHSPEPEEV
jgi:hypothetical protein